MSTGDERDPGRLARDHEEMYGLYHRYLLRIAERDAGGAERLLDEFAVRLEAHISEEDGYWVPLFEDRFGMSKGFGAELLRSEHRVIEKLLGALRFLVRSVAGRGGVMAAQDVLNLLEESFRFRGVLSHHHAREDNVMIPALRELAARGELPE